MQPARVGAQSLERHHLGHAAARSPPAQPAINTVLSPMAMTGIDAMGAYLHTPGAIWYLLLVIREQFELLPRSSAHWRSPARTVAVVPYVDREADLATSSSHGQSEPSYHASQPPVGCVA